MDKTKNKILYREKLYILAIEMMQIPNTHRQRT